MILQDNPKHAYIKLLVYYAVLHRVADLVMSLYGNPLKVGGKV